MQRRREGFEDVEKGAKAGRREGFVFKTSKSM